MVLLKKQIILFWTLLMVKNSLMQGSSPVSALPILCLVAKLFSMIANQNISLFVAAQTFLKT